MTQKCVQCGKRFTLTESEIKFFKSKKLSLPKRCKQCREINKANKKGGNIKRSSGKYESYYVSRPAGYQSSVSFLPLLAAIFFFFTEKNFLSVIAFAVFLGSLVISFLSRRNNKVFIQEFDTSLYKYTFYDTKAMVKHYVKHGERTACSSMEDYLVKANMVVLDKDSISKCSKDNDNLFYNKKTNEFVVIAKAGYIRTYFIASDRYFNKQ